jgi:hypothetical protein
MAKKITGFKAFLTKDPTELHYVAATPVGDYLFGGGDNHIGVDVTLGGYSNSVELSFFIRGKTDAAFEKSRKEELAKLAILEDAVMFARAVLEGAERSEKEESPV